MIRTARRLALTWSLLSAVASAAPADPWLRIQSANFELFTTAGERAGRDLVRHFEQVREFFLQVFGPTENPSASSPFTAKKNFSRTAPTRPPPPFTTTAASTITS
jgi:hypothetical protein